MITIQNLRCSLGHTEILKGIDLFINTGEKIALIGPSGAGKSTFLNILTKRISHYSGSIDIDDKPLAEIQDRRQLANEIGMMTQEANLIPPLSVHTNVLMGEFRHWSFFRSIKEILWGQKRTLPLLRNVHMDTFQSKKVSDLSGGEKQRVAMARLLMQNPKIILADEPIASLDPQLSKEIIHLLNTVSEQKTLIVSLHQKDFALNHFDRIIGLRDGQVFFDLNPTEISEKHLEALYAT